MNDQITNDFAAQLLAKAQPQASQEPAQQPAPVAQQQNNSQQSIDNTDTFSYLRAGGGEADADPEVVKARKLLDETFKGDPTNLAKSYLHQQSDRSKLESSLKEYKEKLDMLDNLASKDSYLFEAIQTAAKGESVENYFKSKLNPTSNVDKSTQPVHDSKLDTGDLAYADESTLATKGLLDLSRKNQVTALEWQNEVLKAQTKYIYQEIPKMAVERTRMEWQQQQDKLRETQEVENARKENQKRFQDDVERVSKQYAFKFDGEHKDLYLEAVEEAKYFLDRTNPKLIHKNAFSMTIERLAREKGLQVEKAPIALPKQPSQVNYNGQNFRATQVPEKPNLSPMERVMSTLVDSNLNAFNKRQSAFKKR